MIKFLIAFALLLPLSSCGTMSNLSQAIADAREVVNQVKESVAAVKPEIDRIVDLSKEIGDLGKNLGGDLGEMAEKVGELGKGISAGMVDMAKEFREMSAEQRKLADKDGDGELDWLEYLAWILGIGGGGVVVARKGLQRVRDQLSAEVATAAAAGVAAGKEKA